MTKLTKENINLMIERKNKIIDELENYLTIGNVYQLDNIINELLKLLTKLERKNSWNKFLLDNHLELFKNGLPRKEINK